MKLRYLPLVALLGMVSACSDKPEKPPYAGVKIGKPYQIYGRWYKPKYEPNYDEIGRASWYGPGFHGGKTASGERFDENEVSAAHRTLPLPSIVRVTNLDNGKSALIKVNDRGPFSHDRILDLSKGAAAKLGVIYSGTAHVRVQFLEKETKEYVMNSNSQNIQYAMNKLKDTNPEVAAEAEEGRSKPKFYVMKVPTGQNPPPAAIPVSEQDAERYPTRNIFEVADNEEEAADVIPAVKDKAPVIAKKSTPTPLELAKPAVQKVASIGELVAAPASSQSSVQVNASQVVKSGIYYIQAGTFGQENNARTLANRLDEFDSRVVSTTLGNRTMYRVMIGPYKHPDLAKNMLSKLSSLGIPDGKIIRG